MAAPKGHEKWGGRQKGTPNKAGQDIKLAIEEMLTAKKDDILDMLNRVSEKSPEKALFILQGFLEYVIPKLARQVDKDGEDANTVFVIKE